MRTLPSVLLSILIAFFPKCPACCIAYLSMFGSVGLAVTPYVEWLYPLLLASLGLHLGLLLAKAHRKGYGPVVLSLGGGVLILASRIFLPNQFITITGISLIFAGSLWNSFSGAPLKRQCCTTNPHL